MYQPACEGHFPGVVHKPGKKNTCTHMSSNFSVYMSRSLSTFFVTLKCIVAIMLSGPRCEKMGLRGFRPGPT